MIGRAPRVLNWAASLSAMLSLCACASLVSPTGDSSPDNTGDAAGIVDGGPAVPITKLDLLFVIQNSNRARDDQANLLNAMPALLGALVSPPCVSATNPSPHACVDPTADHPQFPAVTSLQLGVVSTDLGTPGGSVPGCADSMYGDDGLLNPIRYGSALGRHEPAPIVPLMYPRPTDCRDVSEFPPFIEFRSSADATCAPDTSCTSDASVFAHHALCNAGLYVNGCGLAQPLEAAFRGLIVHDARATPGNTSPNAGFVRPDALLALVFLTYSEDESARDCDYALGSACASALDVYNSGSSQWASPNLSLRFYLYDPGGPQDPTWPLNRYADPASSTAGFLALKPGHPERVIFAAITGIPLRIPNPTSASEWDALLGAPSARGPDDFVHRDSTTALTAMSPEGPISMRQANLDPRCLERVVPSCRREGTPYNPAARTTDLQQFAWPARRFVEVARRFDQSPWCGGEPCHNAVIASVCANDYAPAMEQIAARIARRVVP